MPEPASIACPACEQHAPAEEWIIADPQQPSRQACPSCRAHFDVLELPSVAPLDL